MDARAGPVSQDLNLHVAGLFHEFFQIDLGGAEGGGGLRLTRVKGLRQSPAPPRPVPPPRPPPPAAALRIRGNPTASAALWAWSSSFSGPSLPGMIGAPACRASSRPWALSPMRRMASGDGPMNVIPQARQISANAAFSGRNP